MKLRASLLSFVAAILVLASCNRPGSTSESSTPGSSPTSPGAAMATLTAFPNPVPASPSPGKTTITWKSGSDEIADVYVTDGTGEKLFASGANGSQEARWIVPGSTTFRLYRRSNHTSLAQVVVTMPPMPASSGSP